MDFQLGDLSQVRRTRGRASIWRATKWDVTGPLNLAWLGDTEGDVTINMNSEIAIMTLPELTGPMGHDADYTGENAVVEAPFYVTDPAQMALLSPSGTSSAGRERRGRPIEHTIVVFPEELWVDPSENYRVNPAKLLSFSGGVWTWDGSPLSAEKALQLQADTFWLWRCVVNRPSQHFHGGVGDAKKNIESVTFQGLYHPGLPDEHHAFTWGDPYLATPSINIEGGS